MFSARKAVSILTLLCPALLFAQIRFQSQAPQPTPPASSTSPDQRCTVQGRVTNSLTGEPVKKATVRLAPRRVSGAVISAGGSNGLQGYAATSEADGSFRFENLDPGEYTLSGRRSGFLNTNYGAKSPLQPGTTLALRPGQQMTNISLTLIPQGVITGKVLDNDGDPVDNARIQMLAQTWVRGKQRYMTRNGGGTNDLGEYRVANVSPGKYYLYAEKMNYGPPSNDIPANPGKPDVRPIRTFYPEAVNIESATPIEIRAGQDLSGMDIRLHNSQTYHVRGKVAGNLPDGDLERANVSLTPRNDEFSFPGFNGGTNINKKDQTFDIAGVAPGSYNLDLVTMGRGMRTFSRQPLDVGAADINDVVLTVIPPGSLHGQIHIEGTPQAGTDAANMATVHVNIYPAEFGTRGGGNGNASTKADGSFTIDDVAPGKYYLNANAPSGTYLKSVRFGSQEILGKELDLSQSVSGELDVVFRYGAAEVDGSVQAAQSATTSSNSSDGQAAPAPTASVVLVPEVLNADGSGMRFGSTNQNGTFAIQQLPPGQYRAYAFEEMNSGQLQNPEVLKQLESRGTEVEVKENDKKQIQVPLISADDLQQILAKLGIESQ